MNELRSVCGNTGAYVCESNFFESDFQQSYSGANDVRLAEVKKKYDPDGLSSCTTGLDQKNGRPMAAPDGLAVFRVT